MKKARDWERRNILHDYFHYFYWEGLGKNNLFIVRIYNPSERCPLAELMNVKIEMKECRLNSANVQGITGLWIYLYQNYMCKVGIEFEYASGHVELSARHVKKARLNGEENGTGSISPLALFHIALLRVIGVFLAEPLLALHKHIAVREHLHNVAQEAVRRERVPPPEDALARLKLAPALEEGKLGRRLHPTEHLPDGELLVQEESLHQRRGDRHGARRDAGRLAVAYQVDFAALRYGFLG